MSEPEKSPGQIVLGWWKQNLRPDADTGAVRGFRARLRRAGSALEALSDARVIGLHEALGGRHDPLNLAALAQLLAHVERHEPNRIAQAFGPAESPKLSNIRFNALIRIEDRPELALALRRALPLVGNACNVAALGQDFLFWSERIRIRWCFDYFGKAPPQTESTHKTAPDLEEIE